METLSRSEFTSEKETFLTWPTWYPSRAATLSGSILLDVDLWPRRPDSPLPKVNSFPSAVTTAECRKPQASWENKHEPYEATELHWFVGAQYCFLVFLACCLLILDYVFVMWDTENSSYRSHLFKLQAAFLSKWTEGSIAAGSSCQLNNNNNFVNASNNSE